MHAFLSVMKGCLTTEYCVVRAKHKGIIKICSQLLLKGKTFFFFSLLKHHLATCLAARREWIKCKCSDEDQ